MDADYFRTLFDYSWWARDRLFRAMEGLSQEEYVRPNGFTYGSLRGILVHYLSAEWIWRSRWQDGLAPTAHLSQKEIPTIGALKERWTLEEAKMRRYLDGLTEATLLAKLDYKSTTGIPWSDPLWQLLAHLVNHGTHHRSEAAEALTMIGRSPGDIDLIEYFREKLPNAGAP
jgi:uncharacterized damage-inducible protein DinB